MSPGPVPYCEGMASTNRQIIMEPERIRALTHPLRLQLLDLLQKEGDLTASQCATLTGESVASCSFHLRMLEKYGFIARAEPRGREKPWRLLTTEGYGADADPDVPGATAATAELAILAMAQRAQDAQEAFRRLPDESAEWVAATRFMSFGLWATAEEAADLGDRIEALLEPFRDRVDPSLRPDGVRHLRVVTAIHADGATRSEDHPETL